MISCELMECVYYNIKNNFLPKYMCKALPQEDMLGLIGDLGICLSQLSSDAYT